MKMNYVVIGNGTAATGCIEGIRSIDKQGVITVVSQENHPVYCRPLISYYLEGKTDLEKMKYRDEDFYDKMNCTVLYGKTAEKIDKENQRVTLDDGSILSYSSLCCATGSSPFVPNIKGLDSVKNKFTFMTLDDTLSLEKVITENSKVLIVGAGLIGLKCAEVLHKRVKEITVCDLSDRILSSILDKEAAQIMQSHLEENGINFMLSDTAAEFNGNTALMKSGKKVNFDILIMAVGVRPNTEIMKNIGADVNKGIIVNEKSETSVKNIYAAGDCTEYTDISCGQQKIMAILPNAYMQGFTAGINMAGAERTFNNAVPMNSIGFFGLHAMTAGSYDGTVLTEKTDKKLKKLFIKDGYLKGFILVGDTEPVGIYTSLIREKTPLDSIDFEKLQETASFAIFSPEIRRQKFGGVI